MSFHFKRLNLCIYVQLLICASLHLGDQDVRVQNEPPYLI